MSFHYFHFQNQAPERLMVARQPLAQARAAVETGVSRRVFPAQTQRSPIMVLSLYSTIKPWRRDAAAKKAARVDDDAPLGIG